MAGRNFLDVAGAVLSGPSEYFWRNKASYDLGPGSLFASAAAAQDAIKTAELALSVLDQIQADPQARKAAIASLPP